MTTSFQLFIYLSEVELQCDFSLAAAAAVDEHFTDSNRAPSTESERSRQSGPQLAHAQLFRSIHSFLTHTAIVSRLLWPSSPVKRNKEDRGSYDQRKAQAATRGRQIRAALSIADDQPNHQRTLRDHLEHFDERLDDWALTSRRHNFIDLCVGPPGSVHGPDHPDVIRWYDQTTGSFHFRGERFDLRAMATWVADVRGRAEQARKYGDLNPPLSNQGLELTR